MEKLMILDHKDASCGYFDCADGSGFLDSGVENVGNPDANTYSIIGNLDAVQRDEWRTSGAFHFLLILGNVDGSVDHLYWSQTTWLTDMQLAIGVLAGQSQWTSSEINRA